MTMCSIVSYTNTALARLHVPQLFAVALRGAYTQAAVLACPYPLTPEKAAITCFVLCFQPGCAISHIWLPIPDYKLRWLFKSFQARISNESHLAPHPRL